MSVYYGRVVKRVGVLKEALSAHGAAGAAGDDVLFSMALHEECMMGSEPGRTIRAVLDEGGKRGDGEQGVDAARAVLEKFLDAGHRGLFHKVQEEDEHAPHVSSLLFPKSDQVVKALHLIASKHTPEKAAALFRPVFSALGEHIRQSKGTPDPSTMVTLEALLNSPHVANACVRQHNWLAGDTGAAFADETVLGPFFAHRTALLTDVFTMTDDGKATLNEKYADGCLQPSYYKNLARILKKSFLVKDPNDWPGLRSGVLLFIQTLLSKNTEGRKSMQNRAECASFNTLSNCMGVLLELVAPLYPRPTTSIKPQYTVASVANGGRMCLPNDEARIACDNSEIPAEAADPGAQGFSFSCEIFHLAQMAVEVSLGAHIRYTDQLHRYDIPYIQQELRELSLAPAVLPNVGATRRALKERLDIRVQTVLELQMYLLDPSGYVEPVLKFIDFTAKYLNKLALNAPSDEAVAQVAELDIPTPGTEDTTSSWEWKMLPEFYIVNNCKVLQWFAGDGGSQQAMDGFKYLLKNGRADMRGVLTSLVVLMANPHLVRNPYTRALQVETLCRLFEAAHSRCPPRNMVPILIDACLETPLVARYIVELLMRSYVDLENLGGSNQFFEKFSYRKSLSVVLRHLYGHPFFKAKLVQLSTGKAGGGTAGDGAPPAAAPKQDVVFVKFFNMMLNDANYLLSEGVKLIKKLHDYEVLRTQPGVWAAMPADERQQTETGYMSATQEIQPYLNLSNEAIGLVHLLVRDTPDAFLMPALVGKVAAMLGAFLVELAGPDVKSLKIDNPQKYSFDHAGLVQQLVECYLCLSRAEERASFFKAVAEEERSYSPAKFAAIVDFCAKKKAHLKLTDTDLFALRDVEATLQHYHAKLSLDLSEVDIPEELQDPIMATLLEDPLRLPGSGEWCNRKVIVQHLLNDSKNPFNRAPLSIDELEEHNADPAIKAEGEELRKKAEKFLEDLRKKAAEKSE